MSQDLQSPKSKAEPLEQFFAQNIKTLKKQILLMYFLKDTSRRFNRNKAWIPNCITFNMLKPSGLTTKAGWVREVLQPADPWWSSSCTVLPGDLSQALGDTGLLVSQLFSCPQFSSVGRGASGSRLGSTVGDPHPDISCVLVTNATGKYLVSSNCTYCTSIWNPTTHHSAQLAPCGFCTRRQGG